ncbi:MAG: hypothetical protein HON46_07420 [Gammaproteobacteria bacterium]|nr:hypothetical protein [Gammaproteobacteria bacterium]MBT4076176.1 hypothetical protein [Gammaproteobacteria bacterium]MBT4860616.1 hypothetical protein [Gammaproteobacteria bacterium]
MKVSKIKPITAKIDVLAILTLGIAKNNFQPSLRLLNTSLMVKLLMWTVEFMEGSFMVLLTCKVLNVLFVMLVIYDLRDKNDSVRFAGFGFSS